MFTFLCLDFVCLKLYLNDVILIVICNCIYWKFLLRKSFDNSGINQSTSKKFITYIITINRKLRLIYQSPNLYNLKRKANNARSYFISFDSVFRLL